MVRLVAIDLDGTLLDTRQCASARNLLAVSETLASGVVVALATARDRRSIALKVPLVMPGLYYLASGGSMVFDTNSGAHLWQRGLSSALAHDVVAFLRGYGHPVLLNRDCTYWVDRRNERVALIEQRYNLTTGSFTQVDDIGVPVHRVTLVAPQTVLEDAAREAVAAFAERANVSLASPDWLDILAPDAGKGMALQWLQARTGVYPEETMAIGDYDSDMPLFAVAGERVAMANAVSCIRAEATHQTASNDEDGVALTLEQLQCPPKLMSSGELARSGHYGD
jgi:Cof subfamily protein (haloacid dehalogenase superfamily)